MVRSRLPSFLPSSFLLLSRTDLLVPSALAEDEIHNHKFTNSHYLGIDHMDKTGKSNRGGLEKAIVIR